MKKLILILTFVFALTLCFVACEELGDNSDEGQSINALSNGAPETEEPTTEAPTTEAPTTEKSTTEKNTLGDTPNKLLTDDMEFVAETLVQHVAISNGFSLEVKIVDEKLYLCDILFDKVTYTKNEDINFDQGIISGANNNDDILSIFNDIKNQENCYLLETQGKNKVASYIKAYYIDGVCYFVSFYESDTSENSSFILRIHYFEME